MVSDGEHLWVANSGSNSLTKLDRNGRQLLTVGVQARPMALAFDGANIWVANNKARSVTKVRAKRRRGARRVSGGRRALGARLRRREHLGGELLQRQRDEAARGRRRARSAPTRPRDGAAGLAFDGHNLWVTSASANRVLALRARRLGDGDLRHRAAAAPGRVRRRQHLARQRGERFGLLHRAGVAMKKLWQDLRPLLGEPRRAFVLHQPAVPRARGVHDAGVRPRAAEQQPGDAARAARRHAGGAAAAAARSTTCAPGCSTSSARLIEERLSPPVVSAVVAAAARAGHRRRCRRRARRGRAAHRVFRQRPDRAVRRAVGGLLCRRDLGLPSRRSASARRAAAMVMLSLAWLNDRLSRRALEQLQQEGRRASQYVENSLRNAEVLQALGMTEQPARSAGARCRSASPPSRRAPAAPASPSPPAPRSCASRCRSSCCRSARTWCSASRPRRA